MQGTEQALLDAVARSIREGELALDEIAQIVDASTGQLRAAVGDLDENSSGSESALAKLALAAADDLERRVADSRARLSSFNIVFFGRTGAGKSTLMSAMGRLDGGRVSPGDSDWTVEVDAIDWHGCRLYDTPGTGGWGGRRSRSELEDKAREATEIADVVILCFDSQSQQQAEFAKVAAWVQEYGKPAIAVLNFRTDRWRHPIRTQDRESRRSLNATVRQHVDNINAELARIGLAGVPVVALNSRRALVARATRPFRGPEAPAVNAELERFGAEYLEHWSNLPALEALLGACLSVGGHDLRLAALRDGLRTTFGQWVSALDTLAQLRLEQAVVLERSIAQMLAVLGYPDEDLRVQHLGPASSEVPDLLTRLEAARGEPFDAPVTGSLARHAKSLLTSHLGAERSKSLRRAENLVTDAFDRRKKVGGKAFDKAVYRPKDVAAALQAVGRDVDQCINDNLKLTGTEGREDLDLMGRRSSAVHGAAGKGRRQIATALQAGGIAASGTGAVLGIVATTQFWNPAGWTAAAILGGLAIGAAMAGFLGRKNRKKAEQKRVAARSSAIGEARSAVSTQFDEWHSSQLAALLGTAWAEAAESVRTLIEETVDAHEMHDELERLAEVLESHAGGIPAAPSAATVIQHGIQVVLDSAGYGTTESDVLLGESWELVDVAEGDRRSFSPHDVEEFQKRAGQGLHRFQDFVTSLSATVDTDELQKWIEDARLAVHLEDSASRVATGSAGPPRIVLLGDYSSSKSSLVKRLLVELGEPVPPGLKIHAAPETAKASVYQVGHVSLVDLPGFQGHNKAHDEWAVAESADAALAVVVLSTNLLLGNTAALVEVLGGSRRMVAKAARAFFVVGRIDEIGADPEESPRDFLTRCRRKEAELVAALHFHGIPVTPERVWSVSADPFGMVGNRVPVTAADYVDRHRIWDGIRPLVDGLVSIDASTASILAGVGERDGLLALLMTSSEAEGLAIEELQAEVADCIDLATTYDEGLADLRLLMKSLIRQVEQLVDDHANELIGEALGAGPEEADALADAFEEWWRDPRLKAGLTAFFASANREVDEWWANNASAIDRRVRKMEARVNASSRNGALRTSSGAGGEALARRVLNEASRIVSAFGSREPVYKIGKALGVKFPPWGAVKGGIRVAKAGAVLGVVATAWDVLAFLQDLQAEDGREAARHRAVDYVRDTMSEVVASIVRGTDEKPGFILDLEEQEAMLLAQVDALTDRGASIEVAIEELRARRAASLRLIERAPGVQAGAKEEFS